MTLTWLVFWIIFIDCLAFLHAFGWFYNWLVATAEENGGDIYTAAYVVGGVFVTGLVMVFPIGLYVHIAETTWRDGVRISLMYLAGFGASGLPMIIGSFRRHIAKRTPEAQADDATDVLLDS